MAIRPSSVDRRTRGATVEAAALAYLRQAGLTEVAANQNYRVGELDLVMLDNSTRPGATLVFVEVRFRGSARFGGGAASIDANKRRRIVRAAQAFLATHRHLTDANCRFDVIEADGDPSAPRLNWLRDAFRADDC